MGDYPARNKMEQDLLDRAQKEFPVGTRYFGVDSNGALKKDIVISERKARIYAQEESNGDIYIEVGIYYVYAKGKWAVHADREPQDNYLIFN